ncbi:protein kinase [Streptomyces sp. NPDC020362]|uniref:protein kinase domain-containing protein n=1 Tax=unclassified Streptomyces TaxID=2593676 RepID=UPI0033D4C997
MAGVTDRDECEVERDDDSWTVPGYIDLKKLGKGGSGRVVIARHAATGRNVAIKYLNEELCSKAEFRTVLRTEARLLSGLTSPHVTRLYEYVEAEQGAAIVMELVYGAALRALLKREGPTDTEAALVVLKGSLLGLAAAHGIGVVHRDYKPENVLVNWNGQTKLVDFGISARTGDRHNRRGTCAYMPPEQWKTEAATPAGDVYAATATLYECLTGMRPFEGPEPLDFQRQHVHEPVPMDRVPEEVRGLVLHGMAKDPALRPPSALDFLRELEWVAENAYGPDWEDRGQSRLAAVAAALIPLAISRLDARLVGSSAELARTVLTTRRRSRLRGRGDVLTGTAAVAVAGLLSLMPSGWAGGAEAHAGDHTQAVTRLDARKDTGPATETRGTEHGDTTGSVSDSDRAGTSGARGSGGHGDAGADNAPADGGTRSDSGSGGVDGDSGTDSRTHTGDTGPDTEKGTGQGDTGTNTDGGTGTENGHDQGDTESHTREGTGTENGTGNDDSEDHDHEDTGTQDTGTQDDTDHTQENTGTANDTDHSHTDSHDDGNTGEGNGGTDNTGNEHAGGDGGMDSRTGTAGDAGSDQGGSSTGGSTDPGARHGHSDARTGDGDPGSAGGTGSGKDVGPGGGTSSDASAGSHGNSGPDSSTLSHSTSVQSTTVQSTTSQSSTNSGNSAGGTGTASDSTPAVTPRQGVPATVEGEPG